MSLKLKKLFNIGNSRDSTASQLDFSKWTMQNVTESRLRLNLMSQTPASRNDLYVGRPSGNEPKSALD